MSNGLDTKNGFKLGFKIALGVFVANLLIGLLGITLFIGGLVVLALLAK